MWKAKEAKGRQRRLKKNPSIRQLAAAYSQLQFAKKAVSSERLALYSQWARLDPRLGEILVAHIACFWREIDPMALNRSVQRQPWPAAFGVLLEHTVFYWAQKERRELAGARANARQRQRLKQKAAKADGRRRALFRKWSECAMDSVKPARGELFFFSLYAAGSKMQLKEVSHATDLYRKWGYFGKDLLVNKAEPPQKTLIPPDRRKRLLDQLLKRKKQLKVDDYLAELNFQARRRQAQRDLKSCPRLKPFGKTRSAVYIRKP